MRQLIRHLLFVISGFFILPVTNAQHSSLDSLFSTAKENLKKGEYSIAIKQFETCLVEARKERDWTKTGNAFIGIGIANDKSGNYENALKNYFQALHSYERAGDNKKQAGTLKNIGNAYRMVKTYDKSSAFLEMARKKFVFLKDSTGLSNVMNDIGIMYMDQHRNEDALHFFDEVINVYEPYAVPQVIAYAYNNAAIIYSRIGEYNKAYTYYLSSIKLMENINEEYGKALVLVNLGDLFNKRKQYDAAIDHNKQGLLIANKIKSNQLIASAYKNLAESYKNLSLYEQSNFYLDKLLLINDTIFREQTARSYAEMETRFQNEQKQKEIVMLKHENTIRRMELVTESRTRYFLIATLSLILLFTFLVYRSYSIKKDLNKALTLANKKLDEANHTKVKLLSVITHDMRTPVSNLFNLLQLQRDASGRFSVKRQEAFNNQINTSAENVLDAMEDLLLWSKSQMDKFSIVPEAVAIKELFEEMANLNAVLADIKKINLVVSAPTDLTLYTDPNFIKVVLRNLLSNALKFTPQGGSILLTGTEDQDHVIIRVKDNGEGMDAVMLSAILEKGG